ncbi:uncharacterized protein LOC122090606 isoform X2 [Macadamia integrifolia]|uniref:uncharacterized protein LOC122090606 isoform X2 n=1 Tax=Macadamia integrifolia TaxID=60698 RepID=UPI001C4E5359|nr:uncharacterized protein LOC122090606 isoform X2 [Macadamia integrifolia]
MSARSRTIKLFCPSLSKLIPLVAVEEQRLDLGSIARTFGLDPASLKLNGHFVSRGVDLISSSVTWKSLLSFFSSRGLSTGANDADALIVDGKLCKAGTKRSCNPSDGEYEDHQTNENNGFGGKRNPQVEDDNLLKKKRSLGKLGAHPTVGCNDLGVKRKPCLENINLLKRKKMDQTNSDSQERQHNPSNAISGTQFTCGHILKRSREDEIVSTSPCKRAR